MSDYESIHSYGSAFDSRGLSDFEELGEAEHVEETLVSDWVEKRFSFDRSMSDIRDALMEEILSKSDVLKENEDRISRLEVVLGNAIIFETEGDNGSKEFTVFYRIGEGKTLNFCFKDRKISSTEINPHLNMIRVLTKPSFKYEPSEGEVYFDFEMQ